MHLNPFLAILGAQAPFSTPKGVRLLHCNATKAILLAAPRAPRKGLPPLDPTIHVSPTIGLDYQVPSIYFMSDYWELGGRGAELAVCSLWPLWQVHKRRKGDALRK